LAVLRLVVVAMVFVMPSTMIGMMVPMVSMIIVIAISRNNNASADREQDADAD
jgi:hypothetical protein